MNTNNLSNRENRLVPGTRFALFVSGAGSLALGADAVRGNDLGVVAAMAAALPATILLSVFRKGGDR